MQSEDIRDLLMMDDTGSNNYFDADLDLNQDIDPLYVAADLQPRCISAITAGIDLNEKFAGLCEVKESYADNSSGELMSDDYDSTTLSKRQAPGSSQPRKKRLRGADLIQSLKRNPIFRDHDELFEENLDDLTRKKLMQKIRNRVSAQESRDRKKMQMGSLAEKNFILEKDNANLRAEVEELKNENKMLRKKLDEASSTKSNSNGTGKTDSESTNVEKSSYNSDVNLNLFKDEDSSILGRAFKRRPSNDSGLGWKAFMMIAIGVALCCVTLPGSPAGGEVVKSSAIVPMIGANAPKANSHALVRLEQICKDYCIQKECSRCQKLLDQQMLGKHFLNLDTDVSFILYRSF